MVGSTRPEKRIQQRCRVISEAGLLPCIMATSYKEPPKVAVRSILVPCDNKVGYMVAEPGDGIYINRPHQKRAVVQKGMIPTLKTSANDIGVVVDGNE